MLTWATCLGQAASSGVGFAEPGWIGACLGVSSQASTRTKQPCSGMASVLYGVTNNCPLKTNSDHQAFSASYFSPTKTTTRTSEAKNSGAKRA